ncbi:MAG: hypothetical protein R3E79_10645 [Caldilineaceae bacterium]
MTEQLQTEYLQSVQQTTVPAWQQRGDGVTLLAGYHFVLAGLFLLGTLILMLPTAILGIVGMVEDPDAFLGMVAVGFVALVTMVSCLLYLAIGYGLWTLRQWARIAALALAIISLFGIPIGTITGAITLWYLLKPDIAAKFEQGRIG